MTCTRRRCPARSPCCCWRQRCSSQGLSGKRWRDFSRASWRDSTVANSSLHSCTKVTLPLACHHLSADGIKPVFASSFSLMELHINDCTLMTAPHLRASTHPPWLQDALFWHGLNHMYAMHFFFLFQLDLFTSLTAVHLTARWGIGNLRPGDRVTDVKHLNKGRKTEPFMSSVRPKLARLNRFTLF